MTSISTDDLFERFKIACDLNQPVDQEKITLSLQRWADKISAPGVAIKFMTSEKEVKEAARAAMAAWDAQASLASRAAMAAWDARDAMDARDARDAMDARDAWDAWDAWDARDAWDAWDARAARDAWDARAARDAWDAWDAWAARAARAAWDARDACFDLSFLSVTAICASSEGEEELLQKWLPIFEAFEAGAFALWAGAETFYVVVRPAIPKVDDQRRLHCEDGPAFTWLSDIRDFYWRGVHVPESWITDRKSLTAEMALSEQNIERRRAACEILGWTTILSQLSAVTIDHDGDPQIGELVEVKLPGEGKEKITARYLRVQCGTGRKFAVCVPPQTKTALDAQAWMLGLPPTEFVRPEVRT